MFKVVNLYNSINKKVKLYKTYDYYLKNYLQINTISKN